MAPKNEPKEEPIKWKKPKDLGVSAETRRKITELVKKAMEADLEEEKNIQSRRR